MFVIGLVGFAIASLAAGMAQDPLLLVVARAVQGVAAAVVAPSALSLITTGFPEGPERTRALGPLWSDGVGRFVAGQYSAASSSSSQLGGRCSWSTCP